MFLHFSHGQSLKKERRFFDKVRAKMATRPNIDPKLWGRGGWTLFFHVAKRGAAANPQDHVAFLEAFARSLPCATCRDDFSNIVRKHRVAENTNLMDLHHRMYDAVNRKLGKPTPPLRDVLATHSNTASVWPFFAAATMGFSGPNPTPQELADLRTMMRAFGTSPTQSTDQQVILNTLRRKAPAQGKGMIDAITSKESNDCCTPPAAPSHATTTTPPASATGVVVFDATTANIMMGLSIAVPLIVAVIAAVALALVVDWKNHGGVRAVKGAAVRKSTRGGTSTKRLLMSNLDRWKRGAR